MGDAVSAVRRLMKAIARMAERDRLMSSRYIGYWSYRNVEAQSKCLRGVVRIRWYSTHGDCSSKAETERFLLYQAEDRQVVDQCGETVTQHNQWQLRGYENEAERLESILKGASND